MRNQLYKRYQQVLDKRKLDYGGYTGIASGAATLGTSIIDATQNKGANYGYESEGASIGKGALAGAALGTSILPGWGTAIGGVVGAGAGLVQGISNNGKVKSLKAAAAQRQQTMQNNYSMNALAEDPGREFGYANADYFKNGGRIKLADGGDISETPSTAWTKLNTDSNSNPNLTRNPLAQLISSGGNAKTLSSDNTLIKGKSHAEGGIQIPELDTEVEGGETTKGNFVFSKNLGFAQQHLPIAKAIGIIEKKPQTPERVNSLRRLRDREQSLAQQQEQLKQINGIS